MSDKSHKKYQCPCGSAMSRRCVCAQDQKSPVTAKESHHLIVPPFQRRPGATYSKMPEGSGYITALGRLINKVDSVQDGVQ